MALQLRPDAVGPEASSVSRGAREACASSLGHPAWRDLGHQLLDLPSGFVRRTGKNAVSIRLGEIRRKLGDASQMKTPVSEHCQKYGVLARRPGHSDAEIRLSLRHMQSLGTVGKHRRESFPCIQPALVHFTDVSD